jgi:hypothetical protein
MDNNIEDPGNELPDKLGRSFGGLGDLLKQDYQRLIDYGIRGVTRLPTIWDAGARAVEDIADRYLPPAVSGAMRDARQFVETNPAARLHRYLDVARNVENTTGIPLSNLPPDTDPRYYLVQAFSRPFAGNFPQTPVQPAVRFETQPAPSQQEPRLVPVPHTPNFVDEPLRPGSIELYEAEHIPSFVDEPLPPGSVQLHAVEHTPIFVD